MKLTPAENAIFSILSKSPAGLSTKCIARKLGWSRKSEARAREGKVYELYRVLRNLRSMNKRNIVCETPTGSGSRWKLKV